MARAAVIEAPEQDTSKIIVRIALAHLKSTTPYSQGRAFESAKGDTEPHDKYDERCWRERMHQTKDGHVFIPAMAFKNCITEAAQFLSMKVPGKRNATYTKHFVAGVSVNQNLALDVLAADVEGERLFVPSDGKRGSGSRVWRRFPKIEQWEGVVPFAIYDGTISEEAFLKHMKAAGVFIGIGRFRPRNNGFYGRFEVLGVEWSEVT